MVEVERRQLLFRCDTRMMSIREGCQKLASAKDYRARKGVPPLVFNGASKQTPLCARHCGAY